MSWLTDLARKLRGIFGPGVKTGFEEFEFATQGPGYEEHPPVPVGTIVALGRDAFVSGWWTKAKRFDIHPGRIGPAITPRALGLHTTDMAPGTFQALLNAWKRSPGTGAAAHFLFGKTPATGVVQMVPIWRNGNHMGGSPGHGWFKTKAGKMIHPNTAVVGVEIDNAGMLRGKPGAWIHKDSGRKIPDSDVFVDERGRGWERITEYQFEMLDALYTDLDALMPKFDDGTVIVPNGDHKANGVPWAALTSTRLVLHAQMDPNRKTDPGPQAAAWVRARTRV